MTRFSKLAALVFALTLPVAARADDASHRAKAEQLIALQHTEKTVEQISQNIASQIDQVADRAAGTDATDAQKAKIDDFKKQAGQMIDSQLGWASMKTAIVDIYTKNLTEDQLDQILAFYKTPAGTALLEKMPDINTQFGQLGNSRVADLKGQLQKAYLDFQQSIKPTAPTLGPIGPAPAAPAPAPTAPGAK